MGKFVGIDLGTSFSVIACIDDNGNPVVIPNKEGENTTPSAVLFGQAMPIVGSGATRNRNADPRNFVSCAKRHMGEKNYKFIARDGEGYSAEYISALILKKLKADAEEFLNDHIEGAVITVPAYFYDTERQATKDAAKIAGLNVLGIINEPTAAALAYGIGRQINDPQRVMVYDLGGGTFDVSILDIRAGRIDVVATAGDRYLGGIDLDEEIINHVKKSAQKQGIDIDDDILALHDLANKAEEAKKILSYANTATISLQVSGRELNVSLARERFEYLIDMKLGATTADIQYTLSTTNLEFGDISKIILVGGSTRIPLVKSLIEEISNITPSTEIHPDEAIAIGAAYHALELARAMSSPAAQPENANAIPLPTGANAAPPMAHAPKADDLPLVKNTYKLHDVLSHSIGIVIADENNPNLRVNFVILQKNTPIPTELVQDGYSTCIPYQSELIFDFTEGEGEDLNYVKSVGSATLKIRPRAHMVPIRCIIFCDSNAIIHLRAIDMEENTDLGEVMIDRSKHNLTEAEIKTATDKINKLYLGE